jgi:hypothetical protein
MADRHQKRIDGGGVSMNLRRCPFPPLTDRSRTVLRGDM